MHWKQIVYYLIGKVVRKNNFEKARKMLRLDNLLSVVPGIYIKTDFNEFDWYCTWEETDWLMIQWSEWLRIILKFQNSNKYKWLKAFKIYLFSFMCSCVLKVHVSGHNVCEVSTVARKEIGFPRSGVTDGCEPLGHA